MIHSTILGVLLFFSLKLAAALPLNLWDDSIEGYSVLLEISQHPVWHKLVLYEPAKNGVKSAIHSESFFLSPVGNSNPLVELQATLQAFSMPATDDPNHHAQCRFRGRFLWLRDYSGLDLSNVEEFECPDYKQWSYNDDVESMSIVFATGYLGNPASYYGHTLLKFNTAKSPGYTKLEDVSVNFGAIVPEGDGPLPYVIKGLLGGYDAGFSHIRFYFHNHNYGENELRDLWEYELNLSRQEAQLIVAHAWEVLNKEYTYYFLDKNCAYRMAELLEVVDGLSIQRQDSHWYMPQSLVQRIGVTKFRQEPLVKSIQYYPSRQTRLYKRYDSLDQNQKDLLHAVVADIAQLEGASFSKLSIEGKYQVLDTLMDYYQYRRDGGEEGVDIYSRHYRLVLAKRFSLVGGAADPLFKSTNAPHLGRSPSMVRYGIAHNSKLGSVQTLSIRPAYYDSLDAEEGHIANAQLSMMEMDFGLLHNSQSLYLRSLDLINIESISNQRTGLPADNGRAWKIKVSIEQAFLDCKNCLTPKLQGDIGMGAPIGKRLFISTYAGLALQDNKDSAGAIFPKASAAANLTLSTKIKLRAAVEHRRHIGGDEKFQTLASLKLRYRFKPNLDVRLSYTKDRSEELSLATSFYW